MNDTWGISGPTFILCYMAGAVALAIIVAAHRKWLFRGDRAAQVDHLHPQQVAYLNGGDRLAVYSVLGGLRAAGALGTGPGGTLVRTGPLPTGVTPLDSAVHTAADGVRARDLLHDQQVTAALGQMSDQLQRGGLALTAGKMRAAHFGVVAGATVVLVGIARIVAGISNDKPVGNMVLITFAALLFPLVALRTRRWATDPAIKAMRDLRHRHSHLQPRHSPSYATYGAAAAAMGIALYGGAALHAMDPAFAAEAGVARTTVDDGSKGSGSGSDGDGNGGGSCGG